MEKGKEKEKKFYLWVIGMYQERIKGTEKASLIHTLYALLTYGNMPV